MAIEWMRTQTITGRHSDRLAFGILAGCVVLALIPACPAVYAVPARDSGVFLYIANAILDGSVPYRDIWDHKPPAVFYLNAFALLLGQRSLWAIWVLELLSLGLAALIGYRLLRDSFRAAAAIFASVGWIMSSAMLLSGGNFTEEYALPLKFASLWLFVQAENRGYSVKIAAALGFAGVLCFLLRPNLIGIHITILLFLLLRSITLRSWHIFWEPAKVMLLAALPLLLLVGAYFYSADAFDDLIDAVFRYNMAYSVATSADRLRAVGAGIAVLSLSLLSPSCLLGLALVFTSFRRFGYQFRNLNPLVALAVIGLPVELTLASLSGRTYGHYYLSWLPIFAVLAAAFFVLGLKGLTAGVEEYMARGIARRGTTVFLALILLQSAVPVWLVYRQVEASLQTIHHYDRIVQAITDHSRNDDTVLMWGAETSINLVANRASPTRFVYQYPLLTPGYQNDDLVDEFLVDLRENKPLLIIDTSSTNQSVPPLQDTARQVWSKTALQYQVPPSMERFFAFVSSSYSFAYAIEGVDWRVYRYSGP